MAERFLKHPDWVFDNRLAPAMTDFAKSEHANRAPVFTSADEPIVEGIDVDVLVDSPEAIKARIRELHASDESIDDTETDRLLLSTDLKASEDAIFGTYPKTYDEMLAHDAKWDGRFAGEMAWLHAGSNIWTYYGVIREVVKNLKTDNAETLYDLGSGYGRVVLYAGIVTALECRGIELVPERAQISQRRAERLELPNVQVDARNVREVDFSGGDIFYMYKPFTWETFEVVKDRLKAIASEKPIQIVSRGYDRALASEPWLERGYYNFDTRNEYQRLAIYESR